MINKLRQLMKKRNIDAVIIPTEDPHLDEYIPECYKLREAISGFTGSAGEMVVTMDKSGLWTDGRYYLQAEKELSGSGIKLFKASEKETPKIYEYLTKELKKGSVVGVDGSLFSKRKLDKIISELEKAKINIETDFNAFSIWNERPPMPNDKLFLLPEKYCGEKASEKIAKVRNQMKEEGFTYYLTAMPDCVMWLLNIRGNDILYTPAALCYLLLSKTEIKLYIDKDKAEDISEYLCENAVTICDYSSVYNDLAVLGKENYLAVDFDSANYNLIKSINCVHKDRKDFITYLKCIKNNTELENIKKAYIKENVALTKSFYKILHTDNLNEYDIVGIIEKERNKLEGYFSPSFDTIAAFGENAAMVHYSPSQSNSCKIGNNGLLLIDTGGQYFEGTTDTTRTLVIGNITEEESESLTLVLKGNISLLKTVFPKGKTGRDLDSVVRRALWQRGYDYNHGTGHGIGYFLNVHEGPHRISAFSQEELKVNMTLSDEPGVYIENKYGIRIENHLCIKEYNSKFLCFDILNHCPIGTYGIKKELLDNDEIDWLNSYNTKCRELISSYLSEEEAEWIEKYTAKL